MKLTFLVLSTLNLIFHMIFFIRAYRSRNCEFTPHFIDKISRDLSVMMLPGTIVIGTISVLNRLFIIFLWLPIVLIIASHFFRHIVKKYPYHLPFINLVLLFFIFLIALYGAA